MYLLVLHKHTLRGYLKGQDCCRKGNPQEEQIYPGKLNWNEWQESGNDTDSTWQDPLFEDPENHVYILKENSPAWDMGITQIDLEHFGPQEADFTGNK